MGPKVNLIESTPGISVDPPGSRRPGDEEMHKHKNGSKVAMCLLIAFTGGENVENLGNRRFSKIFGRKGTRHLLERLNFRAVLDEPPANFRGFIQDLEEGDPEDIRVDSLWKGCGKAEKWRNKTRWTLCKARHVTCRKIPSPDHVYIVII